MLQLAEGEDLVSSLVITPDKRYFVRISGRRFVDDIVAEIEFLGTIIRKFSMKSS